jgi:hypothetical protein
MSTDSTSKQESTTADPGALADAGAEGHALKSGRIDDADTDGHLSLPSSAREREIDDVEGHGVRDKLADDLGTERPPRRPGERIDDVEGHVNYRPLDRTADR